MKNYSDVRGFNYQPSYAWNSYEAWRFFDPEVFDREIGLGKKHFPNMNTVRLWLSYDAFRYEEDRQAANFETALKICQRHGCKAIVCLFNCWHDKALDNGGIYHPMMIPGSIWCAKEDMFDSYIQKIVAPHANDERILIWDICNEPYSFGDNKEYREFMEPYETAWLKKMTDMCHAAGVTQPCGISHHAGTGGNLYLQERTAEFTDIFLIHPYFIFRDTDLDNLTDESIDVLLNKYKELSRKYNKPVLCTETCWGSRDDKVRAKIVERTLDGFRRAGIGFVAHALHWSHVADLHTEEDGPLSEPGNLMFIDKDGSVREGHEIFAKY